MTSIGVEYAILFRMIFEMSLNLGAACTFEAPQPIYVTFYTPGAAYMSAVLAVEK